MGLVQGSFKHETLIRGTLRYTCSTRTHKFIKVSLAKVLVVHKITFFLSIFPLSHGASSGMTCNAKGA